MSKLAFRADLSRLGPDERALLDADYPRFSAAELARRRSAFERAMEEAGADIALVYEAGGSGGAVQWLTGWPVTQEAAVIVVPGRPLVAFIEHYNHLPMARVLVGDTAEVRWGERQVAARVSDELAKSAPGEGRLGIVGRLAPALHDGLTEARGPLVDLNAAFTRLRLVKSDEEVSWAQVAAAFTDLAIAGLVDALEPGLTEHELSAATQASYLGLGGHKQINFLAITPMDRPALCVPPQFTSSRRVAQGDAVTAEISALFWGYAGQILRTIALGPPTGLYRDLHEAALAAFHAIEAILRPGVTAAEIVEASSVIEDAGFSIWDDLVHGYVGGYLPPVLGSKSRPAGPVPDFTYEAGMMLVVQPNVITTDHKAGVQTGELLRITETGAERMHAYPRGLIEI